MAPWPKAVAPTFFATSRHPFVITGPSKIDPREEDWPGFSEGVFIPDIMPGPQMLKTLSGIVDLDPVSKGKEAKKTKKLIILAEEDEASGKRVEEYLHQSGFQIIRTRNGIQTLRSVRSVSTLRTV